jgi:hypothetical protein
MTATEALLIVPVFPGPKKKATKILRNLSSRKTSEEGRDIGQLLINNNSAQGN